MRRIFDVTQHTRMHRPFLSQNSRLGFSDFVKTTRQPRPWALRTALFAKKSSNTVLCERQKTVAYCMLDEKKVSWNRDV